MHAAMAANPPGLSQGNPAASEDEILGGGILVQSELGKGSVFSLIIPTRIEGVCEVASDRSAASLPVGS